MLSLGPVAFAAPWLMLVLPALPVLWWLLRVTPPAPRRLPFPPLLLLRQLPETQETPARTPWWLLLLRIAAAALIVLGLARPVLGPGAAASGDGVLLVVMENGWASAGDWAARIGTAEAALRQAERAGRPVALLATAEAPTGEPPRILGPMPASDAMARLAALRPQPWPSSPAAAATALRTWREANPGRMGALLVSDNVAEGEDTARLRAALAALGPLTVASAETRPVQLLLPPVAEADRLRLTVLQTPVPRATEVPVLARTADGRTLARAVVTVPANQGRAEAPMPLPLEIRNQVARLDIAEAAGAGASVLLDERFRRRPVGILAGAEEGAETPLLGELFYLDRALNPFTEIRRGAIDALLARPIAVIALADRPVTEGHERAALTQWVEQGGTLVRFAGSRVAEKPDGLLPVQLRADRQLGGALAWEQPQRLAPFPEGSPFAGLAVPAEVSVERQILAEPGPRLTERTWARLADGTPLVTAEARGKGRIVLFHVTANADWSNLPLSGLFVQMLQRIVALSAGVQAREGEMPLAPLEAMDGFGQLGPAPPAATAVSAREIEQVKPSPRTPPGWYGTPGQQQDSLAYRRAVNLGGGIAALVPAPPPPEGASAMAIEALPTERDLGPWLLGLAMLILAADLLLSLGLRGLLALRPARAAVLALALAGAALPAQAQGQATEGGAALATRIGYIATGDGQVDGVVRSGLVGLSDYVNRRTAAALAEPVALTPGADDLAFYPLLYWMVLPDAPAPDAQAVAALNAYMQLGGIILFDTRDEGSGEGFAPGARAALRRVTRELAIPPLAPVAEDHVLTRAFYLLPELPGRFAGGQVWVARDQDRANDSVSPVIIGGHDWASAWAIDGQGNNPYATIPGGTRQRTLAYRFGVNLVMYALTGNYKGDQVHVPAILERLGN